MDELLKKLQDALSEDTPEAALERALALASLKPPDPAVLEAARQIKGMGLSIQDVPALVASGMAYREKLVGELERLAGIALCSEDEKLPEGFVETQAKGDVKQIEAAVEIYRKMAEKKFPLTCQDCGSHNISGRSSISNKPGEETAKARKPVDVKHLHG